MDTTGWLRGAREGRVKHDWATLRWSEGGLDVEAQVTTMPAMVDGVVRSIDARTQQLAGEVLEEEGEPLLLPTPKLMALRHAQKTVKVPVIPCDVVHTTGEQWGERWLQAVYHATGRAGQWLVSDGGKSWTLCELLAADVAIAEGFLADSAAELGGIPCGPADWPGVYAVRVPGAPQVRAGKHNLLQNDYSQHGFWWHPFTLVGGQRRLSREVLQDPALGRLVSSAGALPYWRQPGVPPLAQAPEWLALLAAGAPPPPDTLRSLPHLIDNRTTPATPTELLAALRDLLPGLTRQAHLCLLAQIALETAEGRLMHNWNVGNVKGRVDGSDGRSWQFFACGEELPLAYALQVCQDPRASVVRQYRKQLPTGQLVDMASVRFVPDHPACCFRAFEQLGGPGGGIDDHAQLLQRRFPAAWARALVGDVRGYAGSLGLAGYYTAAQGPYEDGCERYYRMYDARLA